MTKDEIRRIYKEKRLQITAKEKMKLDDLMLIHFQELSLYIPNYIMTYAPFEKFNEFNPEPITDFCFFKNPNSFNIFPVMDTLNDYMHGVVVDDNTPFDMNKYGILEPIDGITLPAEEIDMVLLPLLAFDKAGYRVGYGKGYYDKFLKECRPDVVKVGFSYFEHTEPIDNINAFDVPMDFCITPHRFYIF